MAREEQAARWFLILSALAIAIVALILTNVWTQNHNGEIATLRAALLPFAVNDTASAMQISLLQSQIVEILMNVANETTVGSGTFVWALSRDTSVPGGLCSAGAPSSYTMQSAGTGYRVNDLITLPLSYLTVTYGQSPVFQVNTVGGAGEVLTFTTLSRGCNAGGPQGTAVPGISIVGTGFTVTRDNANQGGGGGLPDAYYNYPAPPTGLVSPVQQSTYTLKQVTIESATFNVLVLEGPQFPMVTVSASVSHFLHVVLFAFSPEIPALESMGNNGYVFPFTSKNMAAISLTDDASCFSVAYPSAGGCFMDAGQDNVPGYLNSAEFVTNLWGNNLQLHSIFTHWFFNSFNDAQDYAANHANFTLNAPLMWVLPAL